MIEADTNGACNLAYYAMFSGTHAALAAVGEDNPALAKTRCGLIGAFGRALILTGPLLTGLGRAFHQRGRSLGAVQPPVSLGDPCQTDFPPAPQTRLPGVLGTTKIVQHE